MITVALHLFREAVNNRLLLFIFPRRTACLASPEPFHLAAEAVSIKAGLRFSRGMKKAACDSCLNHWKYEKRARKNHLPEGWWFTSENKEANRNQTAHIKRQRLYRF